MARTREKIKKDKGLREIAEMERKIIEKKDVDFLISHLVPYLTDNTRFQKILPKALKTVNEIRVALNKGPKALDRIVV